MSSVQNVTPSNFYPQFTALLADRGIGVYPIVAGVDVLKFSDAQGVMSQTPLMPLVDFTLVSPTGVTSVDAGACPMLSSQLELVANKLKPVREDLRPVFNTPIRMRAMVGDIRTRVLLNDELGMRTDPDEVLDARLRSAALFLNMNEGADHVWGLYQLLRMADGVERFFGGGEAFFLKPLLIDHAAVIKASIVHYDPFDLNELVAKAFQANLHGNAATHLLGVVKKFKGERVTRGILYGRAAWHAAAGKNFKLLGRVYAKFAGEADGSADHATWLLRSAWAYANPGHAKKELWTDIHSAISSAAVRLEGHEDALVSELREFEAAAKKAKGK